MDNREIINTISDLRNAVGRLSDRLTVIEEAVAHPLIVVDEVQETLEPGEHESDVYVAGDNGVGYWITNLFSRTAEPECTCPDFQHRHKGKGTQCKHLRRLTEVVRYAGI